jgi:hypothetical protein
MTILKNSAKCTACGEEISSIHRHDFKVHFCLVEPTPDTRWEGDKLVLNPDEITWRFGVDGGRTYIRRIGFGYEDTSEFEEDEPS